MLHKTARNINITDSLNNKNSLLWAGSVAYSMSEKLNELSPFFFCRIFYKVKSRSAHMKSHAEQEKKAAALRQKEAEERAAAKAAAEAAAVLAARQQNGTRQLGGDSTNDDSSDREDEDDEDWQ